MQPGQTILVADENGNHNGEYVENGLAHTGRGKRHLAISVLLYNSRGQVLLQHRKHKIHDDIWDFTGSTHHLHRDDGTDETSEEATYRCLKREYGIKEKIDLRVVGSINYYAPYGKFCENEHDIILVGEYNGKLKPNKEVAYNYKWIDEKAFLRDIEKYPKKYAPWAVLASKNLKELNQNHFKMELEKFLRVFDPYAEGYFRQKLREANKYPKLVSQLYKDLEDFSLGGKKMRGYLVWLGFQVAGGRDLKKILPVSLAFELVQDFFLIHDDIIDQSDLRREKPTVHKKYEKYFGPHYGVSQAIMIGDLALVESIRLFDEQEAQIRDEFLRSTLETVFGESLDVEYAFQNPSFGQIREMVDLKAVRYSFRGPLRIGAIMGKASPEKLLALDKFSLSCGVAFQIQDDFLGVFGDEKTMGKSLLSDMVEGKNTLMIYKARELTKGQDRKDLDELWGKKTAGFVDLLRVRKIIRKYGAHDWVFGEKEKLTAKARGEIGKITKDAKLGLILSDIVGFVVGRQN